MTDAMIALQAGQLKKFAPVVASMRALDDTVVVYLDNTLSVRLRPFPDAPSLFSSAAPDWSAFCGMLMAEETGARHAPHKWNDGFSWTPARPDLRYLRHEQAAFFDEMGWVMLPGAVLPQIVRNLEMEADKFEVLGERALRDMREGRSFIARPDEITFTTHLVRKSKLYANFYRTQLFRDVCHDLIGDDVRLYWDQAVYKKPGVEKPFPWHQDNGYTFVAPQQYLTFWIALTPADERNGCMWLAPHVHKAGTIHHELTPIGYDCFPDGVDDAVAIPAAPGDVLVLSSLTPHQTAHNRTDKTRKALVAQFSTTDAVAITEDAWGKIVKTPATDPVRQFEILRRGQPVV